MLYYLLYEKLFPLRKPVPRLSLQHVSHGLRQPDRAVPLHRAGAVADRQAPAISNRPVYSRGGPQVASEEGRDAHHGRRAHHHLDRDSHAALGRSALPYVWVALLALMGYGLIGFLDDYNKLMAAEPRAYGKAQAAAAVRPRFRDGGDPAGRCRRKAIIHRISTFHSLKQFHPDLQIH